MVVREQEAPNSGDGNSGKPAPDTGAAHDASQGASALVGTTLSGRYYIERLVGEGGMGAVYQASHTHMRKRLAVKVLHPEMSRMPEVVARFEREAMAAAHIEHPNIAAATDFGKTEDGSFFLVLEYVEGTSLRERMNKPPPMGVPQILHIARQIAQALQRAHARGIVHRDLKPENIMLVERDGDPDFVKVLDFGIAKVPVGDLSGVSNSGEPVLTQLGMVYGTPEYMAPEQAAGQEVDGRTDLYSLGVILFEMLCGMRPFEHESKVALMGMHVTAPVPRMSDVAPHRPVPPDVERLVRRLLEKDAQRRYDDTTLLEALDNLLSGQSLLGTPSTQRRPGASFASLGGGDMAGGAARPLPTPVEEGAPMPVLAAVAPGRRTRDWAVGGFVAAVALVGGLLFVRSSTLSTPEAPSEKADGSLGMGTPDGQANEGTPSVNPEESKLEATLAEASELGAKGDHRAVIALLGSLAPQHPERADLHRLLWMAHSNLGFGSEAMTAAQAWLKADPNAYRTTPALVESVRNAALEKESQDVGFALLEDHLGPKGWDILYEFAYGPTIHAGSAASIRARSLFARFPELRSRFSPALQVTMDLRAATTCEAKKSLLPRAREVGDARTLAVVKPWRSERGCGFAQSRDCYPCLRRDPNGTLQKTIATLEDRAMPR